MQAVWPTASGTSNFYAPRGRRRAVLYLRVQAERKMLGRDLSCMMTQLRPGRADTQGNEMSGPGSAAEHAEAWTKSLAERTIESLRAETRANLLSVPWVAAHAEPIVAGAALVACLAAGYAEGATPRELRERAKQSASSDGVELEDSTTTSFVLVAVLMVRSGAALPDPRWWQPLWLAEHLSLAVARVAVRTETDPEPLLTERLWWPEAVASAIATSAARPAGIEYTADLSLPAPMLKRVVALIRETSPDDPIDKTIDSLGEGAGGRLDLILAAAQVRQLTTAYREAHARRDEELTSYFRRELSRIRGAVEGLSMLELDLMRPVSEDEQVLFEAARLAKQVLPQAREGVAPLPDLFADAREVPSELAMLLGLGMHGFQQRSGPIVHWSVVVEGPLPESITDASQRRVGVGIRSQTDGMRISVRLFVEGEPIDAPITYPAESADGALSLALLALTERVRIDFFARDRRRAIRHIHQATVTISDQPMPEIRERAVAACRSLFADGEEAALDRLRSELEPDNSVQAASGFLLNDWGKADQLLEASSPETALGPYQTASGEDLSAISEARREMLLVEAERVETGSAEAEEAAAQAEARYLKLVQTIRGKDQRARGRTDQAAEIERITRGVASDTQAVIHLAIGHRNLEVLWADRRGGDLYLELLRFPDVGLQELRDAVRAPESGTIDGLDRPGGAGRDFGEMLVSQARRRGVRAIAVCPSRWLHQLPVHALPIGGSTQSRLLDEVDVVYGPSSAILTRLAESEPRQGGTLIAAVALRHAEDEAAVVEALAPDPVRLAPGEATPERVLAELRDCGRLHVCSHGDYIPRDYFASRLHLTGVEGQTGALTVARLLAEADLSGVDLAVLGACFSGAGETEDSALDIAGGIDSAFLAAGTRNLLSALWEIDDFAALLVHSEFYRQLAEGASLRRAYASGVNLLRSGAWEDVQTSALGELLTRAGVNLDVAFEELREDQKSDDDDVVLDFAKLSYWAPFRLCGLGRLASEPDSDVAAPSPPE